MERKFYSIIMTFIAMLFVGLFIYDIHIQDEMDKNYFDLLELSERQSDEYEELNDSWMRDYDSLQSDYGRLMIENEQLREELGYKIKNHAVSEDEMILLAKVAQTEAGDYYSHSTSQVYVVNVVINRVLSEDFPDSISEVVYQKVNGVPQFSVASNGMLDNCSLEESTLKNVKNAFKCEKFDLPKSVCYFYSTSVKDNWVNSLETYIICEGTVFAYEN